MANMEKKLMSSPGNAGDRQLEEDRPSAAVAASAACESRFSTKSTVVLVVLPLLCAGTSRSLGELTYDLLPWDSAYVLHRYRDAIERQPSELRTGYLNDKVLFTRKIADSKNTAIVYPVPMREMSRLVAAQCVSLGAAIGSYAYLSSGGPGGLASEVSIA